VIPSKIIKELLMKEELEVSVVSFSQPLLSDFSL
jgi:hypothetical protein